MRPYIPASPCEDDEGRWFPGLSIHDYFAAKALQAIIAADRAQSLFDSERAASEAYTYAEAMIEERSK